VARYTRNPDGSTAEFGIVVEDAWQGRGLGHALMEAIETCARERGLKEMIGYVLLENEEMATLMRTRMYDARRDEDDPGVVRFSKPLQPVAAAPALGSVSVRDEAGATVP
jgi:acetyltransferase